MAATPASTIRSGATASPPRASRADSDSPVSVELFDSTISRAPARSTNACAPGKTVSPETRQPSRSQRSAR